MTVTHVRILQCVGTYARMYVHYVQVCGYIHTYVCTYVCFKHVGIIQMCVQVCGYLCKYKCVCVHLHMFMHVGATCVFKCVGAFKHMVMVHMCIRWRSCCLQV